MGRPTTEGYWWSGKFWKPLLDSDLTRIDVDITHLPGISSLEETGASIEDCANALANLTVSRAGSNLPIGASAMLEERRVCGDGDWVDVMEYLVEYSKESASCSHPNLQPGFYIKTQEP
jgi:hypothetical protein